MTSTIDNTKDPRIKSDNLRFRYINPQLKGKEILDIGSQEGYLHNLLIKANPDKKIYSLDSSGSANYKIDLDNPKKLPKKFDTIIAGEIIEHLESPINFIKYCKSQLKPNGRIILTTPNAIGLQYLRNQDWCVYYKDYRGHTQTFTLPMLKRIFQDQGFNIIKADYINAFWINNPMQFISLLIKKLRPDLFVVADLK
jgi:2-polyprenyl-3-methyl-5-hydroxy-6-metoxy-1,4-benzoquinol methylase